MNTESIKKLFDVTSGGYVILSRKAVKHLLECIEGHDKGSFYCHLLIEAHYGEPEPVRGGGIVKRGETCIDVQELMKFTGWKKSKVYEELKLLEKAELLVRINDKSHNGHCLLSRYEEHCGRNVRKEERPHNTALLDNQTEAGFEEFFGYYLFTTKTKGVEKEKARREWRKLSLDEREAALRNVPRYTDAVTKSEHLKMACNYLKDKSFKF